MSDQPAPGWYPDPSGEHESRYWDGAAWTARTADRNDDAAATSNQAIEAVEPALTAHSLPAGDPAVDADTHRGKEGRSLHRSSANRWLAGVAGGLGESIGIPPILVRAAFIALSWDWWSALGVEAAYITYIPALVYLGLIAAPPDQPDERTAERESSLRDGAKPRLSSRAVLGFGLMCVATALAALAAFEVPFDGLAFLVALPLGPLALWLTVSGLREINRSGGTLLGRYFVGFALVLAFVGVAAMGLASLGGILQTG